MQGWRSHVRLTAIAAVVAASFSAVSAAPAFQFPTDNHALLAPGGNARFFAPTPGRTWEAGQFGCVRTEGWQMHEGIDILATKHDRHGEPADEVRAAAGGEVVYINHKVSLSNYGIYVVLRHRIEGLEVFTLYAHLREARADLVPGTKVREGERIGMMGRTANTVTPIGKDRAHVHFEIDLMVNDRFAEWLKARDPGSRNDHGPWNGRNLLGLDPAETFRAQETAGSAFSLLHLVRTRREMCRVLVANTRFPWLRRHPILIHRNPTAERAGIVAYEVSLDFNGIPFRLMPRSRGEIDGPVIDKLLSVNEPEYRSHPCRRLIAKKGRQWTLTERGRELIDLLTY